MPRFSARGLGGGAGWRPTSLEIDGQNELPELELIPGRERVWQFRDQAGCIQEGAVQTVQIFYEHLVNRILEDLVGVLEPKFMEVMGIFTPRGGVTTTARVEYRRKQSTRLDGAETS